ncbi:MAG: glycosyltransferase family 2 protein [Candidatus Levyibacteriota bacterium]
MGYKQGYSVSIIVPARDEEGTIKLLAKRLPQFGSKQELIFVEGNSKDNTWQEIKELKGTAKRIIKAYKQKGKGKADAVRLGFSKATGDILVILDSDLSVPPEDLPKFFNVLASGKAGFVNGSRFVYPKEKGAMRFFNHLGNKFFAYVFSLILRQKITDTLCGTKALFRKDYLEIKKITKNFSARDPYGDFELLLGAGLLRLSVREVAIKYKARIYGKSKISPFLDGIKLVLLLLKAFWEYLRLIFSK